MKQWYLNQFTLENVKHQFIKTSDLKKSNWLPNKLMSLEIENQLKCKVTISYVDKQWNNDIYMIENQLKGKVTISYVDKQWTMIFTLIGCYEILDIELN